MVSVMKNGSKLDDKSDSIVESENVEGRGLESGIDGSNEDINPDSRMPGESRVSAMELDSGASDGTVGSRTPEDGNSGELGVGSDVSVESCVGKVVEEEESRVSHEADTPNKGIDARNDRKDHVTVSKVLSDKHVEGEKGPKYNSLLSEFDAANDKGGLIGTMRTLSYGFEAGDMVWGKVKSHPWWPGQIFNEALAGSQVHRTRREGHVVVAFFGDSSYGWFDPAELIPFDPNYAEKCHQTTSRNFNKAVEDAVDEVSRRQAAGLVCKCRNPYNFRATTVEGCFAVDVPDYEASAVYTVSQIEKAQNSFKPTETVSFVRCMAFSPSSEDHKNLNFVKSMATLLAYRKAIFEEYDETYAQAFGAQQGRPSRDHANLSLQPVKVPSRAPLSGPLVIAETLGSRKIATKLLKVKDHSKKDRYLFKRRDETVNLKADKTGQSHLSPSASNAYMKGSTALGVEDYVLQERSMDLSSKPQIPVKHEQTGFISGSCVASRTDVPDKEVVMLDRQPDNCSLYDEDAGLDTRLSLDEGKTAPQEVKEEASSLSNGVPVYSSRGCPDLSGEGTSPSAIDGRPLSYQQDTADHMHKENGKFSRPLEDLRQPQLIVAAGVEGNSGGDQGQDGLILGISSPVDAKDLSRMSASGGVKKKKVLKWPVEGSSDLQDSVMDVRKKKKRKKQLSSEASFRDVEGSSELQDSVMDVRKKKKRKKQLGSEARFRDLHNHSATKKVGSLENNMGKSSQIGLASSENFKVENQKKNSIAIVIVSDPDSAGTSSLVGEGNTEFELQQFLSNLRALALDPFHGMERNRPTIVSRFFLQFRSCVYQKSLVFSPTTETETETGEVCTPKSAQGVGSFENNSVEHARDLSSSKPVKPSFRSDNPTIAGRKRPLSDRQEDIARKKLKKISNIKSLASKKKASQKISEGHWVQGKESATTLLRKSAKPESASKVENFARPIEPTMLVMKFPPRTSLPSAAELKARFARFGPMDQSGLRVFWKSSTCRVVFLHKSDAQVAYGFAISNNSLFGNGNFRCYIREVGAAASEGPESRKGQGDDNSIETPRTEDPAASQRPASAHLQLPSVQLKSCLKKSSGDESGQVTSNGDNSNKETSRVKFMLAGEESTSSRDEQLVGNRNNINNASFADGGGGSVPSVGMDYNSRNFQKITSASQSTVLTLSSQFVKAPLSNSHHTEVSSRNPRNLNNPTIPPSIPFIDISQQMLSLLTRCNDVVTNVTGLLGYEPYHPL